MDEITKYHVPGEIWRNFLELWVGPQVEEGETDQPRQQGRHLLTVP